MKHKLLRVIQASENLLSTPAKLRKALSSIDYDYVYVTHPLNVLELYMAGKFDKRVILTEHGGINAYNIVYRTIKEILYPKASCYIVPTVSDTKLYQERGYPAIYIPHFRPELTYKKNMLSEKTAISVGRLTEAKRQWVLIDLWNQIVNKHGVTDWKLKLIGDGNLRANFVDKIDKYGLQQHVTILPPIKDVEKYYNEASLFLLTSESEGFGMVLIEALSFGIPCISYDCPSGPRDMIVDGKNGYLIQYDNAKKFETAVLSVLTDHESLVKFGDFAYEMAKMWDKNHILRQWKRVLT